MCLMNRVREAEVLQQEQAQAAMRHIRLVAIDLDGTLLDPNERISEGNHRAVTAIRRAGIQVVLVTARSFPRARVFAQELGLRLPVLCCSGALVADSVSSKELVHIPVPAACAVPIVRFGLDHHLLVLINRDGAYLAHPDTISDHQHAASLLSPAWVAAEDLLEQAAQGPTFLRVMGRPDVDIITNEFEERFSDRLKFIDMVWRGVPDLGIYDRNVSKGNALRDFCAERGIGREQVMAIGDHISDRAMFEAAGLCVAMENADPQLQALADMVTTSNAHDGVAVVLRRVLLERFGDEAPIP